MKRIGLPAFLLCLVFSSRLASQPCDCKWPVDAVILQTRTGNDAARTGSLYDSLNKAYKYLYLVTMTDVPRPEQDPSSGYFILRAGQGNRIAMLGAERLKRQENLFIPVRNRQRIDLSDSISSDNFFNKMKQKKIRIAAGRNAVNGDSCMMRLMPRFDLILREPDPGSYTGNLVRFDRGKIIFFKEDTIR